MYYRRLSMNLESLIMINGDYLLDSSIIIDIFKGDANTILIIQEILKINVPVIVIGELYYGANLSLNTARRIAEINQLELGVNILEVKKSTTRFYGEIKNQLKRNGTPIPENDVWIAAIAIEHKLTLITKDNHFKKIEGINIEMVD